MTNIGVGLLSPCTITISMLVGSVISYGILLPYIEFMQGIIGISMVLADGAFHLLCILLRTLRAMRKRRHSQLATLPFMCLGVDDRPPARSFDDRRWAPVFLCDRVYDPAAAVGYVTLSVVSIAVVPYLYPQLRPAHVAIAYLVVPLFTFCNAYGVGVTDVSVASTYGRIALFLLGSRTAAWSPGSPWASSSCPPPPPPATSCRCSGRATSPSPRRTPCSSARSRGRRSAAWSTRSSSGCCTGGTTTRAGRVLLVNLLLLFNTGHIVA